MVFPKIIWKINILSVTEIKCRGKEYNKVLVWSYLFFKGINPNMAKRELAEIELITKKNSEYCLDFSPNITIL